MKTIAIRILLVLFSAFGANSLGAFEKPTLEDLVETSTAGHLSFGKERLSELKANGSVTLKGTEVTGPLEVNGDLYAQDAEIGALICKGHAYLHNSRVLGKTEMKGFFSAEKCTFGKEIAFTGHKVVFNGCKLKGLTLKKVMWPFDYQYVELGNNTVCDGSISFESNKGRVVIKDGSELRGKVVGGETQIGLK